MRSKITLFFHALSLVLPSWGSADSVRNSIKKSSATVQAASSKIRHSPALAVQAIAAIPAPEESSLTTLFDAAPPTRKGDQVDDYFGTKVADPYRWLEDDNSPETKAWTEAQNRHTEKYLASVGQREGIVDRLKHLWNYERFGAPSKHGKHWIYSHNSGLQNQNIIYKSKRLYGERQVLLDPNSLSADGTAALSATSFSKDGRYMAYAVSKAGSDWSVWHVRDVESGQDLPDTIEWTKFSGAVWTKDGKGFYYTRYPEPKPGEKLKGRNENSKVYYHRLGTTQGQDELIYERSDHPSWRFGVSLTDDGRYLLLYQREGTEPKNRIWVKDLKKPDASFTPLFDNFDASYSIVGNAGQRFYVQTTSGAPRGKLIAVDLNRPGSENWKTVIAQHGGRDVLEDVRHVGKRFVAVWGSDAHQRMRVYGPRGGLQREVKLPGIGSVSGFSPKSRHEKKLGFLSYSSFNHPATNFRLNLETGKLTAYRRPKIDVDPSKFEVRQVFYPSKDGTKIPMFIVHKKGLVLDGQNPTYLYGYGGFNISLNPNFKIANIPWLEKGGIYAVANLRGGGEYGKEWHDAGRLQNKQNVFDDFIAAAEYLIKEGYTSSPKLAIGGGSNGGLLVGAAMTQRPDLFGAAIPEVGVMDMLRFHLFTVGAGWKSDYGSSETKEGFDTLIKYSPLHNLKPGTSYPATMVMTGDHDDRVVPAHSFKFAAALQAAQGGPAPALLRVETNAGHGAGKPLNKLAREIADKWAFLIKALNLN